MQVILLAWLPGTHNFAAQDDKGTIGFISANNNPVFEPRFPDFVSAAVSKYGYVRFPVPKPTAIEAVPALADSLNAGGGY